MFSLCSACAIIVICVYALLGGIIVVSLWCVCVCASCVLRVLCVCYPCDLRVFSVFVCHRWCPSCGRCCVIMARVFVVFSMRVLVLLLCD